MQLNTLWLELPVDAWRVSSPAESLKTAGARLIDRLGAGKNTPKCAGHSRGGHTLPGFTPQSSLGQGHGAATSPSAISLCKAVRAAANCTGSLTSPRGIKALLPCKRPVSTCGPAAPLPTLWGGRGGRGQPTLRPCVAPAMVPLSPGQLCQAHALRERPRALLGTAPAVHPALPGDNWASGCRPHGIFAACTGHGT